MRLSNSLRLMVSLIALGLVVAACSGGASQPSAQAVATAAPAVATMAPTAVSAVATAVSAVTTGVPTSGAMEAVTPAATVASVVATAVSAVTTAAPTIQAMETASATPGMETAATPAATGSAAPAPSAGGANQGQQLATQNGCIGCHSITGASGAGPTWKGLYGSQVQLTDGSTVTADDAYIKESILNPNAKVVKGFQPIMPSFNGKLDDSQIQALIDYIKTLK